MNTELINTLIVQLIAIREFSKDIHYTAHGEAFYGKHLFADRIQENISGYIDQIKEDLLLGNGLRPLASVDYLTLATKFLQRPSGNDDKANFSILAELIDDTLKLIACMNDLSRGDENLIGEIAQNLQNSKGLLNLYVEG